MGCFFISMVVVGGHAATVRQTLSRGSGGGRTIPLRLPRPPFSFVPSTARFLFGGSKRKCGVETVGSEKYHLMIGCERTIVSLNARFSRHECTASRLDNGCRTLRERYFWPAQKYPKTGVGASPYVPRLPRKARQRWTALPPQHCQAVLARCKKGEPQRTYFSLTPALLLPV